VRRYQHAHQCRHYRPLVDDWVSSWLTTAAAALSLIQVLTYVIGVTAK